MKSTNDNVIVYGLGYVGLTLSIVLAENGYNVFGYDTDKNKIRYLKKNKSYLYEKNIDKRLKHIKKNNNISYLNNIHKIKSKYHIICVGTPINKQKKPINNYIQNVLKDLVKCIKKNDCIILRSTVPIGFTRKTVIKYIYNQIKFKPCIDYNICFAPERTVEGKALEELINNPQLIAGYSDKCLEVGVNFFNKFSNKIITLDNLESAEIAKLIDNSYRDNIFAFSNQISLICDEFKLDTIDIIKKCNSDYPRNNIPLPSPGVGGACLTKDPYILVSNLKKDKAKTNLIIQSRRTNELTLKNFVKKISSKLKLIKNPQILVCGIAFKGYPENSDMRFSTSLDIINQLKQNKKNKIFIYDPIISKRELTKLNYEIINITKTKRKFHTIIFANNHNSFKNLEIDYLNSLLVSPKLLCDCWGLLKDNNFNFYKKFKLFWSGL